MYIYTHTHIHTHTHTSRYICMYVYSCENIVLSRLSPQWLCGNSCTWANDVVIAIVVITLRHIVFMITYIDKGILSRHNMRKYTSYVDNFLRWTFFVST